MFLNELHGMSQCSNVSSTNSQTTPQEKSFKSEKSVKSPQPTLWPSFGLSSISLHRWWLLNSYFIFMMLVILSCCQGFLSYWRAIHECEKGSLPEDKSEAFYRFFSSSHLSYHPKEEEKKRCCGKDCQLSSWVYFTSSGVWIKRGGRVEGMWELRERQWGRVLEV